MQFIYEGTVYYSIIFHEIIFPFGLVYTMNTLIFKSQFLQDVTEELVVTFLLFCLHFSSDIFVSGPPLS